MPFATLGLPPLIVKGVRAAGHSEPMPIQRRAIPIILHGNDLIGAAQTGTGKTAAYLLPTLTRLLDGPRRLRAIVLAATRELAAKVETNARDYARFTNLHIGVAFHGVPIGPQERMLHEQPVDLLVVTPPRLLELHSRQAVTFDDVEMLVLDEADRMIELGMAADLRRALKLLPETRQTLMFSATIPPELNRIAKEALVEPVRVDLAAPTKPAAGITQAIYPVPAILKTELLIELLSRDEVRSVIVFARTKLDAERLARQLQRRGLSVAALHDNRSQSLRERTLGDLKRGRIQVLLATDLASRGLDLDGILHVVNYDVPHAPEDYAQRVGRTTRPEAPGDAFTLMSPEEQKEVAAIETFLGRTVPRVILPDFNYKLRPAGIQQVLRDEVRPQPGNSRPAGGNTRVASAPTRPPARAATTPRVATTPRAKAHVASASRDPDRKHRPPAKSGKPPRRK